MYMNKYDKADACLDEDEMCVNQCLGVRSPSLCLPSFLSFVCFGIPGHQAIYVQLCCLILCSQRTQDGTQASQLAFKASLRLMCLPSKGIGWCVSAAISASALVSARCIIKGHVVSSKVSSEVVVLLLIQATHGASLVLHDSQFEHAESLSHAFLLRQGAAVRVSVLWTTL